MGQLLLGEVGVNHADSGPEGLNAEHTDDKFDPVLHKQTDAIAFLDAHRLELVSNPIGSFVQLDPGDVFTLANKRKVIWILLGVDLYK